jgi:glycosyltransferase involved in cell wall biosynthesis
MSRRPRVVWLLESGDATGTNIMALRRMSVLADRIDSTPLVLRATNRRAPASWPLRRALQINSLAGEIRIARADVIVTTGERTLPAAAPRLRSGARLVHFVHADMTQTMWLEAVMRTLPRASVVVVPLDVDPAWFARTVGLRERQVIAFDDFTLPDESLLGTGAAKIVLVAGALTERSGILDLVAGFDRAGLPGWQLRIAGRGEMRPAVEDYVDTHGLLGRVRLLGQQYDLTAEYAGAGVVVRLDRNDVSGLPVLEALTAGIPVIGSVQVPAVRRLVEDSVNGLVLDRTDPIALADALTVVADDTTRATLARGARSLPGGALTQQSRADLQDGFEAVLDSDAAPTPSQTIGSAR